MRIIHAADFHLDSPFDALTPEQAIERRAEQRQILERLVELARATRAELVLLPGDLLDGDRVYQETIEALIRTLGQIDAPVFIAPATTITIPTAPLMPSTSGRATYIFSVRARLKRSSCPSSTPWSTAPPLRRSTGARACCTALPHPMTVGCI